LLGFLTRKADLQREVPKLSKAMKPGALLWLAYPKGGAQGSDLNRDIIREAVAALGLETVAIVAVDAVWSALRCKQV